MQVGSDDRWKACLAAGGEESFMFVCFKDTLETIS